MGIGKTNSVSGSGAFGLQIVGGTTRPKNPTHGMFWANTPNEITDIYLSAEKPTNPVAGALWVRISNFGGKKIVSPVSKESITVYPLSAEQYINGAWVVIEAISYQDGEWVDWWNGELFENGKQYENVTGGWTSNGYTRTDGLTVLSGTVPEDGTITLTGSNSGVVMMGTAKPIDLRGFSSVTAYAKDLKVLNSSSIYLMITKNKTNYSGNKVASADFGSNKTSVDIPIDTSLQGEYYIVVGTGNSAQQGGKITKVILNK